MAVDGLVFGILSDGSENLLDGSEVVGALVREGALADFEETSCELAMLLVWV